MFPSSKPTGESLPATCEQSIIKAVASYELFHALLARIKSNMTGTQREGITQELDHCDS